MSKNITVIFPDTNLFLQCKPLAELDWALWGEATEVRVVVCKAVQREIDALKGGGNTRKASRARSVASFFRKIIRDTVSPVVRIRDPLVSVSINPECVPSIELENSLDYGERDDQLVGTVYAFQQDHPEADVELLTDDVTVLSTARSLSLPSREIPDSWLLAPEKSPQDREIDRLNTEINALRAREPVCIVRCNSPKGETIKRFSGARYCFLPLSQVHVRDLTGTIEKPFPMKTHFSLSPDPPGTFRIHHEYSAPNQDQIDAYVDDYKKWRNATSRKLESLHTVLQRSCEPLRVNFTLKNEGRRPAKDAVVTFSVSGDFLISAVDKPESDTSDSEPEAPSYGIVRPLNPPKGRWIRTSHGFLEPRHTILGASVADHLRNIIEPPRTFNLPDLSGIGQSEPDLFYGDGDVGSAQAVVKFTCSQWRHAGEDEQFIIYLHPYLAKETAGGLLTCRIEAENLAEPETFQLPLKCTIEPVSSLEPAKQAVDAVIRGVW